MKLSKSEVICYPEVGNCIERDSSVYPLSCYNIYFEQENKEMMDLENVLTMWKEGLGGLL